MQEMKTEVEKIAKAKPDPELRVCRRAVVGKTVVQQGDCYFHRVADDHPRGAQIGSGKVQVAVGQGEGSHHVAEGAVKVYAGVALPPGFKTPGWLEDGQMLGPLVVAETEAFKITHPVHPHHQLPEGCWQTTYQADYTTRQRVVD